MRRRRSRRRLLRPPTRARTERPDARLIALPVVLNQSSTSASMRRLICFLAGGKGGSPLIALLQSSSSWISSGSAAMLASNSSSVIASTLAQSVRLSPRRAFPRFLSRIRTISPLLHTARSPHRYDPDRCHASSIPARPAARSISDADPPLLAARGDRSCLAVFRRTTCAPRENRAARVERRGAWLRPLEFIHYVATGVATIKPARSNSSRPQTTMAGRRPGHRGAGVLFRRGAAADRAVEPDILEAPLIVDAVHLRHQPLELRPTAVRGFGVEQDRPGIVLDQLLLDLPDELLALSRCRLSADCWSISLSSSGLQ